MPSGNLLVEGGRKGMLVRLEGLRIEVSRETGRTAAFSVCVCVGMGACVCMWRGRSLEVIYLAFETVFLIIPELADQWAPGTCLSPPSQSENCKDVLPCQTPFYKIRVLGIWAQVSGLGSNILSALIHACWSLLPQVFDWLDVRYWWMLWPWLLFRFNSIPYSIKEPDAWNGSYNWLRNYRRVMGSG